MASTNSRQVKKYLIFKIESEEYGLNINYITTIIKHEVCFARVPKTPCFLKGVFNLRGEIIPVISLRLKLGLPEEVIDEETRIIIVKFDEISAGLIVDCVFEVLELVENETESITNIEVDSSLDYISGIGKSNGRIINLLNLQNLLSLSVTE